MLDVYEFAGHEVAYQRAGTGAPVVLLHNGGTSHAIWRHTTAALAGRYETYAVDLLGYGASARPGTGYTLDNYVDMVAELVDRRGLAPVALVGNCMGSAIALRFAMLWPNTVCALVLVNPLTEATFRAGAFGTALRLQRRAPRLMRAATRALEWMPLPGWAAMRAVELQLARDHDDLPEPDADALCACYANDGQWTSMMAVLDDMDSYAALDAMDADRAMPPICTVWGTENRVLSADAGRELNRVLRPAREVWLDGAGHLPMLERPDEVSAAIGAFLDHVAQEDSRAAVSR